MDYRLIELCRVGDSTAIESFVQTYQQEVHRLALSILTAGSLTFHPPFPTATVIPLSNGLPTYDFVCNNCKQRFEALLTRRE